MSLEDLYFSEGNGSGGDGGAGAEGRWEGETWGRGGNGNCSRNVIYERIKIFKNKNKKTTNSYVYCTWREGEAKAT